MPSVNQIISSVVSIEGGYSNNPSDPGGPTKYGITQATARRNGYAGDMRDLSRQRAIDIYHREYFVAPGFDRLYGISPAIAAECFECGVNQGVGMPGIYLQRLLNVFNRQGRDYKDVTVDGRVGPATVSALVAFLKKRGEHGEEVMLKGLNVLQGARYIDLAQQRGSLEDFVFGWLDHRVSMSV